MRPGGHRKNLVFQSEHHPLVTVEPRSPEQHAQRLIHTKAYVRAREEAAGLKVLDLGCNNGYGTRLIAEAALEVCGVDVSERAIQAARQQSASSNIRYELADGDSLRFDVDEFDLVTSFQVIEHVVDVPRYLLEISRVLKPGGRAIFTTPNGALRLIPGRAPWNVFHVREFAARQLLEELEPYFAEVTILGLFAEGSLYRTELRRIERAKQISRNRALFALKKLLLTHLREDAIHRIEALIAGWGRSRPTGTPDAGEAAKSDWSLDSLAYRDAPLDDALDFMAICRKS